jgi:hypothetical protein
MFAFDGLVVEGLGGIFVGLAADPCRQRVARNHLFHTREHVEHSDLGRLEVLE